MEDVLQFAKSHNNSAFLIDMLDVSNSHSLCAFQADLRASKLENGASPAVQ